MIIFFDFESQEKMFPLNGIYASNFELLCKYAIWHIKLVNLPLNELDNSEMCSNTTQDHTRYELYENHKK